MANYSKTTDFAAKDALPTGNAGKIVKGTEIDDEFVAIQTAIATKLDTATLDYKNRIVSYNHVQKVSDTSNTSQTEFDIGLSVTLSPASASNKLLIIAVVHGFNRAGDDAGFESSLFLDSVKQFETSNGFYSASSSVSGAGTDASLTFVYEHSPGSTASLDIDVKANAIFAGSTTSVIYASGTSLTVLEIEP